MSPALKQAFIFILDQYMQQNFTAARQMSDKILRQSGGLAEDCFYQCAAYASYWLDDRAHFDEIAALYAERKGSPETVLHWQADKPKRARFVNVPVYTPDTPHQSAEVMMAAAQVFMADVQRHGCGRLVLGTLDIEQLEHTLPDWFHLFNGFFMQLRQTPAASPLFLDVMAGNSYATLPETEHGRLFQLNLFQANADAPRFELVSAQLFDLFGHQSPEYRAAWEFTRRYHEAVGRENGHTFRRLETEEDKLWVSCHRAEATHQEWRELLMWIDRANHHKTPVLLDLQDLHFLPPSTAKQLLRTLTVQPQSQYSCRQPMVSWLLRLSEDA